MIRAVLFDRDGTLVRDVPYNGDPDLVEPMPGAAACVQRLRGMGLKVGVVTNQSAVGRGLIDFEDVERVNLRIERFLGPYDTWKICPHAPWDQCDCRKPSPALVTAALKTLQVAPGECWMVGDQLSDLAAARQAGVQGVLLDSAGVEAPADVPVVRDLSAFASLIERTVLGLVDEASAEQVN